MHVFVPEAEFVASAVVLDEMRLRNQVNECLIIAASALRLRREGETYVRIPRGQKVPWSMCPGVKMWVGYIRALMSFAEACIIECARRDGLDGSVFHTYDIHRRRRITTLRREARLVEDPAADDTTYVVPMFMGNDEFHNSHRSKLIGKFPQHYRPLWPDVPENLGYVWPTQRTNA